MVIRRSDGVELPFANYNKHCGRWTVTPSAGGGPRSIDRGLWGFTLMDGVKQHKFRRNLPFHFMIERQRSNLSTPERVGTMAEQTLRG